MAEEIEVRRVSRRKAGRGRRAGEMVGGRTEVEKNKRRKKR